VPEAFRCDLDFIHPTYLGVIFERQPFTPGGFFSRASERFH
jgi:hypothetical protein